MMSWEGVFGLKTRILVKLNMSKFPPMFRKLLGFEFPD